MDQNTETKLCKRCNTVKAITEFRLNQRKTNLKNTCKACDTEMSRIYYENNRDIFKKAAKKYADKNRKVITEEELKELKEKRRLNYIEVQKKWIQKNPDKVREYVRRTYMKILNSKLAEQEAKKMEGKKE